jgi:DNA-binding XRE family transcriptional regulator
MAQSTLAMPEIRSTLDLSRERMARVMDVSTKSIERWEQGATLPTNSRVLGRLARLQELIDLGLQIYTRDGFRIFLRAPLAEFGGRSALQMLEQDQADKVLAALAADYEGQGF